MSRDAPRDPSYLPLPIAKSVSPSALGRDKTSGCRGRSSSSGDLPARFGSLRRFQADSRAGSARDEKKPAVVMSKTYTDLQDFYGSDGTRTRDLRRDRPFRASFRAAGFRAEAGIDGRFRLKSAPSGRACACGALADERAPARGRWPRRVSVRRTRHSARCAHRALAIE